MTDTKISLEDACRRLKENDSTLTILDLSGTTIGDAGCMALGFALKNNEFIKELNLANTGIGPNGSAKLATTLKHNTLERLYLMGNVVGDKGAESFAGALKLNGSLRVLNLARNCIGDIGCSALAEALMENAALFKLYLYENTVSNTGASALAELILHNTTLQELFVWDNRIGTEGLDELEHAFHSVRKAGSSCIQLRTHWKSSNTLNRPQQAQAKPKMKTVDGDIVARLKVRASQLEASNDRGQERPIEIEKEEQAPDSGLSSTAAASPSSSNVFAKFRAEAPSLDIKNHAVSIKQPDAASQNILARLKAQATSLETPNVTVQEQPTVGIKQGEEASDDEPPSSKSPLPVTRNSFADLRAKAQSLESKTSTVPIKRPEASREYIRIQQRAKVHDTERNDSTSQTKPVAPADAMESEVGATNAPAATAKLENLQLGMLSIESEQDAVNDQGESFDFAGLRAKALGRQQDSTRIDTNELRSRAAKVEVNLAAASPKRPSHTVNKKELQSKALAVEKNLTEQSITESATNGSFSYKDLQAKAQSFSKSVAAKDVSRTSLTKQADKVDVCIQQACPRVPMNDSQPMPLLRPLAETAGSSSQGAAVSLDNCVLNQQNDKSFTFSQLLAKAAALEAKPR
ncbi:hypothetical protein MPSEU_000086600 [Mayamaea pseudoterrestris]|nr:hypothetical protein MPSEU_000086600 [Mayamaea pseudoterrestris]